MCLTVRLSQPAGGIIDCTIHVPEICQTFSLSRKSILSVLRDFKQLLDEVEHDIMNYENRGLFYPPKPKAEAGLTDTRF